ncbi:MAG TPA: DUF1707 domain-containing protein [Solirubrobacteraceae bacterium]|nr:DUF1707 domain-containing protein [Solirubrobacteraceae bacterium]
MPDPDQLRVSDADRQRLADELHEHTVAGRLTAEEYEERLGAAYEARTRADLDAQRSDLPVSTVAAKLALAERKTKLRRRLVQEASGSIAVSAVCVAIWLAAGVQSAFWPAWVIVFSLMPVARDAWRLLGPGSDLEVVEARMRSRHERKLARERMRARYRRRLLP